MTPNFITDAQKEREEWLQAFSMSEEDVQDDDEGMEFIRLEATGPRVYLPPVLQSRNLTY